MHTRLAGITGEELRTSGCYVIPVEIGNTSFSDPYFVCTDNAMIPVSDIIEQDVVRAHGLDLLTTKRVAVLNGEEVPILNWSTEQPVWSVRPAETPIMLVLECVIPPRAEIIIAGNFRGNAHSSCVGVVEMAEMEPHGASGCSRAGPHH